MKLDAAARRRYARQLLLGEVGEAGQERLLDSRFHCGDGADERASAVAADYLRRAGCEAGPRGEPLSLPDAEAVRRFAGRASLEAPAAAVLGAFAAVEHLKSLLGVGESGALSEDLTLVRDP